MKSVEEYNKEVELIRTYRKKGLSYKKIAGILNRSVRWIYNRINHPKTLGLTKEQIKHELLVPYVLDKSHTIDPEEPIKFEHMFSTPSLRTHTKNKKYIFEILANVRQGNDIRWILGTIYFYQMVLGNENIKYVLVIPKEFKHFAYFSKGYINKLVEYNIVVLFL